MVWGMKNDGVFQGIGDSYCLPIRNAHVSAQTKHKEIQETSQIGSYEK